MKISNSKKQLAKLLIEAGVTQFPDGANWAAQDKDKSPIESSPLSVMFYSTKPLRPQKGDGYWFATVPLSELVGKPVKLSTLIPNWHQTALSRDEFDQIVAKTIAQSEPDADGWIEWKGGECPVAGLSVVDVKYFDVEGFVTGIALDFVWGPNTNIVYYRKTRSESEQATQEPKQVPVPESKPTIEQLAQDYRNAKNYADRLQKEAGEAAVKAEEFAVEIRKKILELQELIGIPNTEKEPELVITNWRDLRVDDLIWYGGDDELSPGEYHVMKIETPDYEGYRTVLVNGDSGGHWIDTSAGWGFIRRP